MYNNYYYYVIITEISRLPIIITWVMTYNGKSSKTNGNWTGNYSIVSVELAIK